MPAVPVKRQVTDEKMAAYLTDTLHSLDPPTGEWKNDHGEKNNNNE